jgi:hypothetical protein
VVALIVRVAFGCPDSKEGCVWLPRYLGLRLAGCLGSWCNKEKKFHECRVLMANPKATAKPKATSAASPKAEAQGHKHTEFHSEYILPWIPKNDHTVIVVPWTPKNDHKVMHIKKRLSRICDVTEMVPRIEPNTTVLFLDHSKKRT